MYQEFWAFHSNFKIEGIKLENLFPKQDDIIKCDLVATTNAVREALSMKIFTPEDGRLGIGTRALRDNDNIAILTGLQPTNNPSSTWERLQINRYVIFGWSDVWRTI